MRGATVTIDDLFISNKVSTHAPHARCDYKRRAYPSSFISFYSRTPCEVRLGAYWYSYAITPVSTHAPHARCDLLLFSYILFSSVSTHAPHARCDITTTEDYLEHVSFYSRTPCEVWQQNLLKHSWSQRFYSRTPCEVRQLVLITCIVLEKFLLTHPMRGATLFCHLL